MIGVEYSYFPAVFYRLYMKFCIEEMQTSIGAAIEPVDTKTCGCIDRPILTSPKASAKSDQLSSAFVCTIDPAQPDCA